MSAEPGTRPGLTILGAPDGTACEGDACLVPEAPASAPFDTEVSQVVKRFPV